MLKQNSSQNYQVPEEIKVVTFIAGEGDISTDLLSPGNQAPLDQIANYMVNV